MLFIVYLDLHYISKMLQAKLIKIKYMCEHTNICVVAYEIIY